VKSLKKYSLTAAILLLSVFCGYFNFAFSHANRVLLEEKFLDRQATVDILCDQIDYFVERDLDWNKYDYTLDMVFAIDTLAKHRGVYAELFNERLEGLSAQMPYFGDTPFTPHVYPEIIQTVTEHERGRMVVEIDREGVPKYDLHLYYRWIPTNKQHPNRLLVIIGVSKFSVDIGFDSWVAYGAIALILVAAAIIIANVIMLCRYGCIHHSRGGDCKWRSETSL
jgi:hypothetical protein